MWNLAPAADIQKRLDRYQKKWPAEMRNVLDNLHTLHEALCGGTKPEQLKLLGFVHSEPLGILAIDQKGPGRGAKLKAFRLYVFPDDWSKLLHLITVGDKSSQSSDLKNAKAFVGLLLKQELHSTDDDQTTDRTPTTAPDEPGESDGEQGV